MGRRPSHGVGVDNALGGFDEQPSGALLHNCFDALLTHGSSLVRFGRQRLNPLADVYLTHRGDHAIWPNEHLPTQFSDQRCINHTSNWEAAQTQLRRAGICIADVQGLGPPQGIRHETVAPNPIWKGISRTQTTRATPTGQR